MVKKDFTKKSYGKQEKKEEDQSIAKRTRSMSRDNIEVENIEKASTKKKKFFKESVMQENKAEEQEVYPNQLEDYISSKKTIEILRKKGVKYLFPIQEKCYQPILEGKDLIGKDRTGSGKTLAFGIPLIERLRNEGFLKQGQLQRGQKPYALIVLPTRELAIQVANEFKSLSHENDEFRVTLLYGGADIYEQMDKLKAGSEIIIGTPGRIMDLYNRGRLSFSEIRATCLDEADEMLNLGFVEDIQKIFEFIDTDTGKRKTQNLLFSATIPSWMHEISKKYQDPSRGFVDLIRNDSNRTSKTVEHMAINIPYSQITECIGDVILCYGGGTKSRCIIFCETKREVNDILIKGKIKQEVQVLHGDIPQKQREITFKAFKEGKVQCLVATNVAARGLDIPEIDLVIQCEPPKDIESYIHRAGRTARAGRKGVCITFYNKKHFGLIERIEKKTNIKMRRVGAPQPQDILVASARDIATSLRSVNSDALKLFLEASHELIEELGAEEALARAIAFIAGVTEKIKGRSLLCSMEGYKTVIVTCDQQFQALGYIWSFLRKHFPNEMVEGAKGMKKLTDRNGAIFDVSEEYEEKINQYIKDKKDGNIQWGHELEFATELPVLEEKRVNQSCGDFRQGSFREISEAKKNKGKLEIFIGGLPFTSNEQTVVDHFSKNGVQFYELRMLYDDGGNCKGMGFGLCKNPAMAQKAVKLDGSQMGGRRIRVNMADSNKKGGRR